MKLGAFTIADMKLITLSLSGHIIDLDSVIFVRSTVAQAAKIQGIRVGLGGNVESFFGDDARQILEELQKSKGANTETLLKRTPATPEQK